MRTDTNDVINCLEERERERDRERENKIVLNLLRHHHRDKYIYELVLIRSDTNDVNNRLEDRERARERLRGRQREIKISFLIY